MFDYPTTRVRPALGPRFSGPDAGAGASAPSRGAGRSPDTAESAAGLADALAGAESALGCFDVGALVGDEPARALERLVAHERRVAAVRLSLARRVVETGAWSGRGHRSPEAYLATTLGVAYRAAVAIAETAQRISAQPAVADALASGEVSESQTRVLSEAVAADPTAAPHLLQLARTEPVRALARRCGKVVAASVRPSDQDARYRRQVSHRRLRTWADPDGTFRLEAALPPDQGAVVRSALEAETDRRFRRAREAGERDPLEAYRADALVGLCGRAGSSTASAAQATPIGSAVGARARSELVVHVDLAAFRRGHLEAGETCEFAGVGPIPVSVARELASDAFIKAVIRDGVDVTRVAHFGRHVPAEVRTALSVRDPVCSVPGCDQGARLEIDHNAVDHARGGPISLDNCDPKCHRHHQLKTHDGYRLTGAPGRRIWWGPDGTVVSADPGAELPP